MSNTVITLLTVAVAFVTASPAAVPLGIPSLWDSFAAPPHEAPAREILDRPDLRASLVQIPAGQRYVARTTGGMESIWIVIRADDLKVEGAADRERRHLSTGDYGELGRGNLLEILNMGTRHAHIMLITIKKSRNVVAPDKVELTPGNTFQEDTPDGGALLVAISVLKLQQVLQLGEPDQPFPGRPTLIRMAEGQAKWLEPGMRDLTNLSDTVARFLWIGW